jgi:hypothetical protein
MVATLLAGLLALAPALRDVTFEEAKKDPAKRAAYVEQLTAPLKKDVSGIFYMGDSGEAAKAKEALQAQWKKEGRAFFFEKESKPLLALLDNPSMRVLPVYQESAIAGSEKKLGIILVGDLFSLSSEDEVKSCVEDYATTVVQIREKNLKVGDQELDANIPALKLVSHRSLIPAWSQMTQAEKILSGKRKVSDAFKADVLKQYMASHKLYSQAFAKEKKVYDDNNENTLQKEIVDFLDFIFKEMHHRIEAGGMEHKLVSKENYEYELVPKK